MRRPPPVAPGAGIAAAAVLSLLPLAPLPAAGATGEDALAAAFVGARHSGGGRALRLLHLGDSHVAGGVFPSSVGALLGEVLGTRVEVSRRGVVGARADQLARGDLPALARLVRSVRPDLVVLTYGTNEARERTFDAAAYQAAFEELLGSLRAAAPGAALVVSGPPEQEGRSPGGGFAPVPGLAEVTRAQERAAHGAGAVFVDLSREMGGPFTLGRWALARPPLVGPDRVHFSTDGYERLARLLVGRLVDLVNRRLASGAASLATERFVLPVERPRSTRARSTGATSGFAPTEETSDVRVYREAGGRLVLTNLSSPPGPPVLSRRGP